MATQSNPDLRRFLDETYDVTQQDDGGSFWSGLNNLLAAPANTLGAINDFIFMEDKGLGKVISDYGPGVLESMVATPSPGFLGLPEESPIDKALRAPATAVNWAIREGIDLGGQGLGQAGNFAEWLVTSPTETPYVSGRDLERDAEEAAIAALPYPEDYWGTGQPSVGGVNPPFGVRTEPPPGYAEGFAGADWGRDEWNNKVQAWVDSAEGQMFLANQTDETGNLAPEALDIPISPQFPYTLRELLDADILTIETLSNAHRNALTSAFNEASAGLDVAEQDYGSFLQNILYGTEDAPGFLSLTGGAVDQYRTGMGERESAFQSRRTQLFDELMAAGVDPSLIADDLAAGDDTAGAIAAIEGGYLDTLNLIGGLSEAAMRSEGERRFSSARGQTSRDYNAAQREADLAEAAALAGVQGAGRTAEMFAPYAEIDPGLFYAGTQAGLPIVQMAETRRGERRADARTAAAQAAAAAEKTEAAAGQQATLNYLSEYLGVPPELIGALSDVGQLGDLFPEFEEQEPSPYEYITDPVTGVTQVEYLDPATNAKYWIDRARLEEMLAPDEPDELSMIEQLYEAFPADAPVIFGEAIEQVRLSGNALNLEEAIQNAMLAAIAGG